MCQECVLDFLEPFLQPQLGIEHENRQNRHILFLEPYVLIVDVGDLLVDYGGTHEKYSTQRELKDDQASSQSTPSTPRVPRSFQYIDGVVGRQDKSWVDTCKQRDKESGHAYTQVYVGSPSRP